MVTTFVMGDTHLGQESILTFKRKDGSPLREFSSIEEHDEYIIEQWNKTVRPQDKVYHCGDVTMHRRFLPLCTRLNGHKRLVMGNHDEHGVKEYLKYFEELYGSRVLDGIIITHIPIHTDCVARFKVNVHGHLHANVIDDPRYINVSCEQVGYTPVSLEEIRARL